MSEELAHIHPALGTSLCVSFEDVDPDDARNQKKWLSATSGTGHGKRLFLNPSYVLNRKQRQVFRCIKLMTLTGTTDFGALTRDVLSGKIGPSEFEAQITNKKYIPKVRKRKAPDNTTSLAPQTT
jgi:hypothetical protein